MDVLKQGCKQHAISQILGEECKIRDDSTKMTLNISSQPTIKSRNTLKTSFINTSLAELRDMQQKIEDAAI